MLDSQLQALVQAQLIAGLAARGIAAGVMKNNQSRQFVAPSTPTVFHTLSSRKKFGWPARSYTFNQATQQFDKATTQIVHTRFQIAGCVPNASPANPYGYTSGDIVSAASDILQHSDTITALVAAGCNVFRVTDNPAIWFQDSSAQNVEWSSFDIIFTHKDVFTTSTGVVTEFDSNTYRVN